MARYNFGGSLTDFAITSPSARANAVFAQPNATGSVYAARTGGSALTDLLDSSGSAIATVSTDANGFLNRFQGPDGYAELWVDLGGGSRFFIRTVDMAYRRATRLASLGPLKAALAAPAADQRSCAIQILGDSTGNDPTDWPYRFAQAIAPLYPGWNVHHRLWDDTTQQYLANTVIQSAAAGPRYLDCSTGTTTRRLDSSVSPHISGPIDVRMKLSMADWTPSVNANLTGRSSAEGSRGWYIGITTAGTLFFTWTSTGNAAQLVTKFDAAGSLGFTDGSTQWIRVVFIPDNGASGYDVKFYTSTDGFTWTQHGSTVTTAGVATLFNNTGIGYELGGVASGVGSSGAKIYEVQIRNGVDGPNIVPAIPDLWPPYNSSAAYFGGAPNLTFVNGSRPGADITYLGDSTRLPKMTPNYGQLVTFLSDSHNEGLYVQRAWTSRYDTWRQNVEAQIPGSPSIILTQNPEASAAQISPGTTWYREHAQRRQDLIGYARQKGLDLIDTYQSFLDAGWPGSLMADPVHPNATGSDLWRDVVRAAFEAS